MTSATFDTIVARMRAAQDVLLKVKGADYTDGIDRLANFKSGAVAFGLTPMQVWGVFAKKHIDAIFAFVRNGKVESEPIAERIADAINYLYLLQGLIEEPSVPPFTPVVMLTEPQRRAALSKDVPDLVKDVLRSWDGSLRARE